MKYQPPKPSGMTQEDIKKHQKKLSKLIRKIEEAHKRTAKSKLIFKGNK